MRRCAWSVVVGLVVAGLAACAGDPGGGGDASSGAVGAPVFRPVGPAAVVAGPVDGDGGPELVAAGAGASVPGLAEAAYVEAEYTVSGTATSYRDDGPRAVDGTFAYTPGEEADYATRIVVRRPAEAAAFNGTVVVEWLDVSRGRGAGTAPVYGAAPGYGYLAGELLRGGYAWVGVAAQGPDGAGGAGGDDAGAGGAAGGPHHPGDAFAYDIYTQVGRALRSPGEVDALGGLGAQRLVAVGDGQAALAVTTYVNGIQTLTHAFDGFLIHGGPGAAAEGTGEGGAGIDDGLTSEPRTIAGHGAGRTIVVETEADVWAGLGDPAARQPDGDDVRLWEVAGTAPLDQARLGLAEDALGCSQPVNRGQQWAVLPAALRALDAWVREGSPAPAAPRLRVDGGATPPAFVLDEAGNVAGGVRTPAVEAPLDVLSGLPVAGATGDCLLAGSTTPLAPDRALALHPSRDDYLAAYEAATDELIEAGFALPEDRDRLLAEADPDRLPA